MRVLVKRENPDRHSRPTTISFTQLFIILIRIFPIPLNLVFVIMDVCPGHILESTNGIEMKLGL